MEKGDKPKRRVKTTDTIFEILEMLYELDGASLAELTQHLDFAKSTLHDHLSTLEDREYIVRHENDYYLSLKFLQHGMYAKNRLQISTVGQPIIDELAAETGEVAWIIVEEHGRAVYLSKSMGEKAVQTHAMIGGRSHLHCLASGKQILAHLSEECVDKIIDRHGLPKKTENTITSREALDEELNRVREETISFNDNERLAGLRAIAAPIFDGDEIAGTVTVSGPANRLTVDRCHEEIKPMLLEAQNEIELRLRYPQR